MKQVYFVHVPKTGGMAIRNVFHGNNKFFPRLKDREHKFGFEKASRFGSISFPTEFWPSYEKKDGFKNANIVFAVIRNPFDHLVSYYSHDAHGTNIDDGWANVNSFMGFKSFEEFVEGYCTLEPQKWHVPMFSVSMYSQLFNKKRESNVHYAVRFEYLKEGLMKIAEMAGMTLRKLDGRNFKRNISARRKDRVYNDYYNSHTKRLVKEKMKWELDTFGYNFSGPQDDNPIQDISDLQLPYDGEIL